MGKTTGYRASPPEKAVCERKLENLFTFYEIRKFSRSILKSEKNFNTFLQIFITTNLQIILSRHICTFFNGYGYLNYFHITLSYTDISKSLANMFHLL